MEKIDLPWVTLEELGREYQNSAAELRAAAKRYETKARRERSHYLHTVALVLSRDSDDFMRLGAFLIDYYKQV